MSQPDHPFDPEYYQHLLQSLTLNSKALIVELTALAETYVDRAPEIVRLIEERISKILPKYKLFSFYLLDSIIKNLGNPYTLLFANNLYKHFTESYLIVEDTYTRQNLINLFQTWMTGQSSTGLDIFPRGVLQKIESFIIKATSLAGGSAQGSIKVSRDDVLREGNYLLQQIIAMDKELDWLQQKSPDTAPNIRKWRRLRNSLVFEINAISEDTMTKAKDSFERLKQGYSDALRRIKQELDLQAVLQRELACSPANLAATEQTKDIYPQLNKVCKEVNVVMILDPKEPNFLAAVQNWGIDRDAKVTPPSNTSAETAPGPVEDEPQGTTAEGSNELISEKTDLSLAQSLGLNFDTVDFPDFGTEQARHLSFDECEEGEEEETRYDPEDAPNGFEHDISFNHDPAPKEPNKNFVIPKSSLKRPGTAEPRVSKRVRFEC
ncbi:hypothetical protein METBISCDRAFT_17743 [Metschnikowia bicuspidata]|uniref:CID domain-containing protein n=1 Tax=Metschnikowia bicuspidata TaxID=27322 RepID=A0A4P9ZD31_9ASCO|nr:hypothetical protein METBISCDRAFT_17743 [Metschnikowia bicuspidata]